MVRVCKNCGKENKELCPYCFADIYASGTMGFKGKGLDNDGNREEEKT